MASVKRLFKRSAIISAFDGLFFLLFPLFLILYFQSIIILFFTIVLFIIKKHYKEIIILLFIILFVLLRLLLNIFDPGFYYIKEIRSQSIIASNLLYDIKVYDKELAIGDIIKVNSKKMAKEDDKIDNIFYTTDDHIKISGGVSPRAFLWQKYTSLKDSHYKSFVGHSLFGYDDYESPFYLDMSMTISIYYFFGFLKRLFKKTGHPSFISGLILLLLYGFDYSLIRVLIFAFFKEKIDDRHLSFSLSVITLLLYEPLAIKAYRFLIPVILRFVLLLKGPFDFKTILIIIQSYFFNEVNILNIIFYRPFMSLIIIIDILAIIGLFISPFSDLAMSVFYLLNKLMSYEIIIRGKISLFYILLIYALFKTFNIKINIIKWMIVLMFILFNVTNIAPSITFIDVGQGDAILIKGSFNDEVILIDTGNGYNYYKLDRYLKSKGIYRIDHLIITHSDSDHSANIKDLKIDYDIKEVITTPLDIQTDSFYLKSLNDGGYNDDNDDSLVYALKIDDLSFLLTGDISKHVEEDVIAQYPNLDIDILKLSHHGSKTGTSEELLLAYDIKMAISSTSGQYGHPAKETIDLLTKWQIPHLSTLDQGDITFSFYNGISILMTDEKFAIIGR